VLEVVTVSFGLSNGVFVMGVTWVVGGQGENRQSGLRS